MAELVELFRSAVAISAVRSAAPQTLENAEDTAALSGAAVAYNGAGSVCDCGTQWAQSCDATFTLQVALHSRLRPRGNNCCCARGRGDAERRASQEVVPNVRSTASHARRGAVQAAAVHVALFNVETRKLEQNVCARLLWRLSATASHNHHHRCGEVRCQTALLPQLDHGSCGRLRRHHGPGAWIAWAAIRAVARARQKPSRVHRWQSTNSLYATLCLPRR
jgi:hypothetical protein